MRVHVGAYRLLLWAYPRRFRARYGDEMVEYVRRRFRDAGGGFRSLVVWSEVFGDLVKSAAVERWEATVTAQKAGGGAPRPVVAMRRQLVMLAVTVAALLVIMPMASRANEAHDAAQAFLDDLTAATALLQDDRQPAGLDPLIEWSSRESAGGGSLFAVVGPHAGRCFVVHWSTLGPSGPRAGVLDPDLTCNADELMDWLPSPPLIENFPGTVPPLEASDLVTPVGAGRHNNLEPFPAERTPAWFIPVLLVVFSVMLWQAAGVAMLLVGRRLSTRTRPASPRGPIESALRS